MPDTRARIMEEAAQLFARSGYESSALADVAASLGMSKAAIYLTFRPSRTSTTPSSSTS
jgi:AcrR family transcriptional regulator